MRKTKPRQSEQCEQFEPHEEIIQTLVGKSLDEVTTQKMAEVFKVMGDPTRIAILHALKERELCVCDLSELLHMTPSAISHQLRILRHHDLVRYRKKGRSVFYHLADHHVITLFNQALDHIQEK